MRHSTTMFMALAALVAIPLPVFGQDLGLLDRIDRNSDGVVTRQELTDHLEQRFSRLDPNDDGTIALTELPVVLALDADTQTRLDKRLEHRLDRAEDRGIDIDAEQLRARMTPTRVRFVARHDQNADEIVTFEEFTSRAYRRFDRVDRDGDGIISGQEQARARRFMERKRRQTGDIVR